MIAIFIIGYSFIVFEHVNHINKAATAILIAALMWAVYALGADQILSMGFSSSWKEYLTGIQNGEESSFIHFVTHTELNHHLVEIASIFLFLLGAMTIVEVVDQYQGFKIIINKVQTTNKAKLLWIISILAFIMSAFLDNLTTTIVMITLLSKILSDKEDRWLFSGMVVIAANSGGAFSPIGDVTTIMLWIGGQITATKIIAGIFLPSLLGMVIPLLILSFKVKGTITHPELDEGDKEEFIQDKDRVTILILGIATLVFVPIFKAITHLPPFVGILFGLGIMWIYTDLKVKKFVHKDRRKLSIGNVLKKVDSPTIMFLLGILGAVAALQSAGHLDILAEFLDKKVHNIYAINLIIGVLSSVIDNVPLVAASIGMYDISSVDAVGYAQHFIQDGHFWEFLAYCAGTGGSILIVGSAAGVAAMGLEKIDFVWYLKKISWLALIGYLAGATVYGIQIILFG